MITYHSLTNEFNYYFQNIWSTNFKQLEVLNLHNISNLYFKLRLKYFNLHRNNIQLHALIKYITLITYLLEFLIFIKNKFYKKFALYTTMGLYI